MNNIGAYAVPCVIFIIVFCALVRKRPIFSPLCKGAEDGLVTVYKIAPTLIGLITAIEMFKVSGAMDILTSFFAPVAELIGLKKELVPLVLLRPVSGGGSTALLERMLNMYDSESDICRIACVMCAASETTFYTTTLYFGSVKIKKLRYTLAAALIGDAVAVAISNITVYLLF